VRFGIGLRRRLLVVAPSPIPPGNNERRKLMF
jgi:hypothetical protein